MTCKDCASENQQHFPGELTLAYFSEHKKSQTVHWLRLSGGSRLLGVRIHGTCDSRTGIKATQERHEGVPFKGCLVSGSIRLSRYSGFKLSRVGNVNGRKPTRIASPPA